MDEKTIMAFAKWTQVPENAMTFAKWMQKDKELAQVPVEKLAQQISVTTQTREGAEKLFPLFQQFQSESQSMFKKGGKMDQAVKKMSEWGSSENDRKKKVLEHNRIPKKDYYDEVGLGNYVYKKIGDEWYENLPDTWGDKWLPYEGTHHYDELERLAAGSPSTLALSGIRNELGEYHPEKTIEGSRYVLKTMPAKITRAEAIENVLNDADYSKPETWYKNGTDSVMVKIDNPRFPISASNTDLTVKAYRNIPWFRDAANAVNWKPAFIRWSEKYNKK